MDFTILSILEIAPPFYLIRAVIEIDTNVGDNYVLNSPVARFTGTIISADKSVNNYIKERVKSGVTKLSSNEFINQDVFLNFINSVKIVFTSNYLLKTFVKYPTGKNIFIGGFKQNYQNDKAEIRYTLNGKEPKTTSNLYKEEILFKQNNSGTENNCLRYRIYYKGKKSNPSTIKFKVIKNDRKSFYELQKN